MNQTVGFGVAAVAVFFQVLIYCGIAFVIWKFYQMLSRIGDDLAAIRTLLRHRLGVPGEGVEPGLNLELPPETNE